MTDTASGTATSDPDSFSNTGEVAYIVLVRDESGFWGEIKSPVYARTAEAAVKTAVGNKTPAGTYVAIPRRSWKPVKVTAKVETTLVVEEAS